MQHASKFGIVIVVGLTAWALASSVDGQQLGGQPAGSSAPPVKQWHLIIAGAKEYEMLQEYGEISGKFRSFDADKAVLKFRVEFEHAAKDVREEYDRIQKKYKDDVRRLEDRYRALTLEQQRANAIRNPQQKNQQLQALSGQMQSLVTEKRQTDQQAHDAVKNMEMVRDFIDYELKVEKEAPIRKMWRPQVFDDKGKSRDMTAEERTKLKGDPKQPGWVGKLEEFEINTPLKVKLRHKVSAAKEPEVEPTPVPTTTPTTPVAPPGVTAAGKDDPAAMKKSEVKLEDRPLVKMVIGESEPKLKTK